jgi:hypothetical protein
MAKATSMANGSSEALPTTMTSDGRIRGPLIPASVITVMRHGILPVACELGQKLAARRQAVSGNPVAGDRCQTPGHEAEARSKALRPGV